MYLAKTHQHVVDVVAEVWRKPGLQIESILNMRVDGLRTTEPELIVIGSPRLLWRLCRFLVPSQAIRDSMDMNVDSYPYIPKKA